MLLFLSDPLSAGKPRLISVGTARITSSPRGRLPLPVQHSLATPKERPIHRSVCLASHRMGRLHEEDLLARRAEGKGRQARGEPYPAPGLPSAPAAEMRLIASWNKERITAKNKESPPSGSKHHKASQISICVGIFANLTGFQRKTSFISIFRLQWRHAKNDYPRSLSPKNQAVLRFQIH